MCIFRHVGPYTNLKKSMGLDYKKMKYFKIIMTITAEKVLGTGYTQKDFLYLLVPSDKSPCKQSGPRSSLTKPWF